MYGIKIGFIVGAISSAILAKPFSEHADIDTCGPSFSGIYDFKIGDVFERNSIKWSLRSNDTVTYSKIIRKFTVDSVHEAGNAKAYEISGIEVRINGIWKGSETRSAAHFRASLGYIDSATHFLNQCKGTIVFADTSGTDARGFHTKIQVATGIGDQFPLADQSTRLKWIGGEELGEYDEDGILIGKPSDGSIKVVYAQGLGLVSYSWTGGFFPNPNEENLTGYIKNGRTVGVITPDESLLEISAIRNKKSENGSDKGVSANIKIKLGGHSDVLGRALSPFRIGVRH